MTPPPAPRIHLDHQATTPLRAEVRAAMEPFLAGPAGVPASFHREGLRARQAIAVARAQCAALVHAESPDDLLFTSGGTEALNLAVKGAAWAAQRHGRHIVVSTLEHPAVLRSVEFLEQHGFTATRVPVDAEGGVDPAAVQAALTEETILVAVQIVNHDLGTIQPVAALGALAAERGIPLLVDATAAGGWLPLDVQAAQISLLALAPHRFHGPQGVGVLYRHRRARLHPLLHGGIQEGGLRAGTENVAGIVGAGAAAELAARETAGWAAHARRLQEQLWNGLRTRVAPVRLNGPPPGPRRAPHLLNVSVEFVEGEGLVLALDLQGVALHSGPACLTGTLKIPPALRAIGLSPALARSSVTLSPGPSTTAAEVEHALDLLGPTVDRLRRLSPLWDAYRAGRQPSEIQAPA